ncbi:unnamed protein product [Prunus armeniaca]
MACATTRVPSSRNLIQTFHSPPKHLVKFFGNHRLAQQNTRPFVAQSVQNEDLRDNTGSFVMQSHSDLSLPPGTLSPCFWQSQACATKLTTIRRAKWT